MSSRRAMLLVGSVWELARFLLVLLLFASLLRDVAGPWIYPWLLAVGSGNLLVAVGAAMLGLFPDRYEPVLPLLRLGQALCLFTLALLLAYELLLSPTPITVGGAVLARRELLGAILLLDAAFLAALFRVRSSEAPPSIPPEASGSLPDYVETEVHDYH
jgi:hypothetical protein